MSVIARPLGHSGVIEITIVTSAYGQAGDHWRSVLERSSSRFGRIYIQRAGAAERRRWHTAGNYEWYRGEQGANQDECPGAMFIWTRDVAPHVEAVDAIDNQNLGRDMKNALRRYRDAQMWQVKFRFI